MLKKRNSVESSELIKTFWDNLWLGVAGLVAWVWQRINGDIKAARAVADAALRAEEFKGYAERADKRAEDFRNDIKDLFEKVDDNAKEERLSHNKVMDALLAQTQTLTDRINSKMDKK